MSPRQELRLDALRQPTFTTILVEGVVEAEVVHEVAHFLRAACAAHHGAAFDLGDLADRAAHGTGRSGDEGRFAFLKRADVQLRLVKCIMREANLGEQKLPACQAVWFINAQKDEGRRAKDVQVAGKDIFVTTHARQGTRWLMLAYANLETA